MMHDDKFVIFLEIPRVKRNNTFDATKVIDHVLTIYTLQACNIRYSISIGYNEAYNPGKLYGYILILLVVYLVTTIVLSIYLCYRV